MNTLIIYLHGIGDNIMLTGVLKEYQRINPQEMIDLVVLNKGAREVWHGNPNVTAVAVYDYPQPHFWNPVKFYLWDCWQAWRILQPLREQYDKVIFPTIQTLPEIVYHLLGIYGPHKMHRICRDMGVTAANYNYDLYPSRENDEEARRIWWEELDGERFAVVHPFSGHKAKEVQVAEQLWAKIKKHPKILVVASSRDVSDRNCWQAGYQLRDLKVKTDLPLGVIIGLLKRADAFYGTDSAIAHLAGFAGTKHIEIFSSKLKPERYAPMGHSQLIHMKKKIIEITELGAATILIIGLGIVVMSACLAALPFRWIIDHSSKGELKSGSHE